MFKSVFAFSDETLQQKIQNEDSGSYFPSGIVEDVEISSVDFGFDYEKNNEQVHVDAIVVNLKKGEAEMKVTIFPYEADHLKDPDKVWMPQQRVGQITNLLRLCVPAEKRKELETQAASLSVSQLYRKCVELINEHSNLLTPIRVKVVYNKNGYKGVPSKPFIYVNGVVLPNCFQRMDESPAMTINPKYDRTEALESMKEDDIDSAIEDSFNDNTESIDDLLDF